MRCAYCFEQSSTTSTLLRCSGCKTRMYCSQECQTIDWNKGQIHKKWCKTICGEDNIDWEIKYINAERGMGLVAKRPFQENERVLVERLYTLKEIQSFKKPSMIKAFLDLAPVISEETLQTDITRAIESKFYLNCIRIRDSNEIDDDNEKAAIGIRLSRANHSCRPNCDWWDTGKELILITRTAVCAQEEFTFAYTNALDPIENSLSVDEARNLLLKKWQIKCSPSCDCFNMKKCKEIDHIRTLTSSITDLIQSNKVQEAFEVSNTVLSLHISLKTSKLQQLSIMWNSFCIGISVNQSTESQALKILDDLHILSIKFFGASNSITLQYETLLKNPTSHPNHYRNRNHS